MQSLPTRVIWMRVDIPKGYSFEKFLFRRVFILKGHFSEVFFILKGHYSEDFYPEEGRYSKFGTMTLWDQNLQNNDPSR